MSFRTARMTHAHFDDSGANEQIAFDSECPRSVSIAGWCALARQSDLFIGRPETDKFEAAA